MEIDGLKTLKTPCANHRPISLGKSYLGTSKVRVRGEHQDIPERLGRLAPEGIQWKQTSQNREASSGSRQR